MADFLSSLKTKVSTSEDEQKLNEPFNNMRTRCDALSTLINHLTKSNNTAATDPFLTSLPLSSETRRTLLQDNLAARRMRNTPGSADGLWQASTRLTLALSSYLAGLELEQQFEMIRRSSALKCSLEKWDLECKRQCPVGGDCGRCKRGFCLFRADHSDGGTPLAGEVSRRLQDVGGSDGDDGDDETGAFRSAIAGAIKGAMYVHDITSKPLHHPRPDDHPAQTTAEVKRIRPPGRGSADADKILRRSRSTARSSLRNRRARKGKDTQKSSTGSSSSYWDAVLEPRMESKLGGVAGSVSPEESVDGEQGS